MTAMSGAVRISPAIAASKLASRGARAASRLAEAPEKMRNDGWRLEGQLSREGLIGYEAILDTMPQGPAFEDGVIGIRPRRSVKATMRRSGLT